MTNGSRIARLSSYTQKFLNVRAINIAFMYMNQHNILGFVPRIPKPGGAIQEISNMPNLNPKSMSNNSPKPINNGHRGHYFTYFWGPGRGMPSRKYQGALAAYQISPLGLPLGTLKVTR